MNRARKNNVFRCWGIIHQHFHNVSQEFTCQEEVIDYKAAKQGKKKPSQEKGPKEGNVNVQEISLSRKENERQRGQGTEKIFFGSDSFVKGIIRFYSKN